MNAAQIREAARLLDLQHAPDDETVYIEEHGAAGALIRIGPFRLNERSLPLHLVPARYLIARSGESVEMEVPR